MPYTASQTLLIPSFAAHQQQQQQQLPFDQGRQWPNKRITLNKRNPSHDYMGTNNILFGMEHANPQPIPNSAHRTSRTGSPSGSPKADFQTINAMLHSLKVSPSSSPSAPIRRASYASSPSRPSPLQLRAEEVALPRTLSSGDLTSSPMLRKKSGEVVKPSLKRGTKSAPATPTCPKYVHFDTQLEHVRLFLQAETPEAVKEDAEVIENDDNLPEVTLTLANWPAPSAMSASKMVFVETIVFSDDKSALNGRVQVQNIAFHKNVTIRYTFDYWQNVHESQAAYKESISKDAKPSYDRFVFNISLVGKVGQGVAPEDEQRTMYFAVRYNVEGREFWDNNGGMNYQVEFKRSIPAPKPKLPSWSMDTPESKAVANEQRSTILAASPPTLSSSPSNEILPLKKKPLANRYDFGASLSATKKVVPTNAPSAVQNARRSNKPFPFYPGVTSVSSIIDGYPTSFGFSDEHLVSSIAEQPMNNSWDDRGPMYPYGGSPTTPISIPKSRPPAGSTGYFDLVNKYCFYGTNASTYSTSPYSSSPPAPLIRG